MNRSNDRNQRKKWSTDGLNGKQSVKWRDSTSVASGLHSDSIHSSLNGVNNLLPKCEQTLRLIASNPNSLLALNCEKELWNCVKQYRHQKDGLLMDYLIGIYVSLLESVMMNSGRKEPYLMLVDNCQLSVCAQLLMYNILIRIGDLNRYLNKSSIAETYYLNATKLDVMRGHAYNQLAVLCPNTQPFKCIYYSVRAIKASVEPIIIAETNLKNAVNRLNCNILKKVLEFAQNSSQDNEDIDGEQDLPERGIDWFYLSVISIYSQNINIIFKPLIQYILINCQNSSNEYLDNKNLSFSLIAVDLVLDWIDLNDLKKAYFEEFLNELKELKSKLKYCLESCEDCPEKQTYLLKALFHDYILRGFSPLSPIHKSLSFDSDQVVLEFYPLVIRVIEKLEKLFGKSMKPKKMRNVALGSILESQLISN